MPPVLIDMLGGIVRHGLAGLLLWLVNNGYLGANTVSQQAVESLSVIVLAILASAYSKFVANQKLVVAQSSPPGITDEQIKTKIAIGLPIPSVLTPPDVQPVPVVKS